MSGPRQLRVVTGRDCELCAELLARLEPYVHSGQVTLELLPLDDHPALRAAHLFRVPVVLEGSAELMWGRIEAAELSAVLGEVGAS